VTPDDRHDPADALARRNFLSRLSLAIGGLAAAAAAAPPLVYVLGPILRPEREVWRDVGPVEKFAIGHTVEVVFDAPGGERWAGVSERMGVWLRRRDDRDFVAFSENCTHLGCPVRWMADADLFMCPCHGGVFYDDGRVAAGPPAAPLRHHRVRVNSGRVEVSTRPVPIVG
jgi:menaquinol-cytochrome c reductase iron-sulfur subunit